MQQADYAAWNTRAALLGSPPLPFRYTNLGEMLSLGEDAADADRDRVRDRTDALSEGSEVLLQEGEDEDADPVPVLEPPPPPTPPTLASVLATPDVGGLIQDHLAVGNDLRAVRVA